MAGKQTATQAKRIAGNLARLEALRKKAEQAQNLLRAAESIAAEKQRAADTRRKIILGALVLDALAKGTSVPRSLDEFLFRMTRDNDRRAFEGWSLADYTAGDKTRPAAKASQSQTTDGDALEPLAPSDRSSTSLIMRKRCGDF